MTGPAPMTAREAAGSALRDFIRDIAPVVPGNGFDTGGAARRVGPVSWRGLPEPRRERWCRHADTVVDAVLDTLAGDAVDLVARELYRQDHVAAGQLNEWTMRHWDVGGGQHVNKEPWRTRARQIIGIIRSAYHHAPPTGT